MQHIGMVIPRNTFIEVAMAAAVVCPVAIKIDEDIKIRIKRLAEARQRTSHWLMREAITQYVTREEKREAFRQDTNLSWDEYRATGLHEKWLRLFEQHSPIYKWTLSGLQKVQSCPRRRASLATNAKPRWATRGAPGSSSYAASFNGGSAAKYFSSGVRFPRQE